jgi:hypothetical protein
VAGPASVIAGVAGPVTVTARDQYGNVAPDFAGTIQLTSSDGTAVLPGDYTFIAGDNGVHTFQVTLKAAGSQTVSVTGTGVSGGQSAGIVVKPAAAAAAAFVQAPGNALVSAAIQPVVTVQVTDAFGNPVGAGVKTKLSLATNPTAALLYGGLAYTNVSGVASFPALKVTKGGQGYTLVATAGAGASAPSSPFNIYATTHFKVTASATQVQAGTSFNITVTALSATNQTDAMYQGTVKFTSTAGALASLPPDYTFTPADAGVHNFTVMVNKAGARTITVFDPTKATAKGVATVTVTAGALSKFLVSGFPSPTPVNAVRSFTVIAQDDYGNTVTNYVGTVTFSSSGSAVLPGPYTFKATDKGKHLFSAKFLTAGTNQSITVADQVTPTISGTQVGITIT